MSNSLRFKRWLEDMDPTADKSRDVAMGGSTKDPNAGKEDYFSALGDEEGIEWEDLTQALENEPWISSHFKLGGMQHKLSPWQIVKGSLTPNGADIQLKPQRGDRTYLNGNRLNKSKYQDKNRYHLSRKELEQFLTTGWTPAVQAAQAGGGDPMGGMGGGMPPI
jgi:hypothetical protein